MSAIVQAEAIRSIPTTNVQRQSGRLDFLDAIRGYAALAVFLGHAGLALWPGFREFDFSRFAIGNFGVILFFLCSGFIIPVSLERQNSLKRFWLRRLCRLFPLYWFSIFVCVVGGFYLRLNLLPAEFFARPLGTIAANATMGPPLLTLAVWLGARLLVSSLTYRYIEQPGIALGQRFTRSSNQG